MPTFLASAALSGVDVILVGDPPPPEGLQRKFGPNVRFEHLPWESMLQQVRRWFRDKLPALGKKDYKKTSDFRIFTPFVVKRVQEYAWWGFIDNDVWLSSRLAELGKKLAFEGYDFVRVLRPRNERLDNDIASEEDFARRPSRLLSSEQKRMQERRS